MEKDIYTAIVLQGGGALGAYEYGVMKELFKSRPGFKPDVITGISIGAVNAAILAGAENPLDVLDKIWRVDFAELAPLPAFFELAYDFIPQKFQQLLSILGNQGMYRLRPEYVYNPVFAPFTTNSIYDTHPLRATLQKAVDPKRLNTHCQVVVTAVNVESGRFAKFGNALSIREGGKFENEQDLSIDHILASGSLPPAFPMTRIKDGYYWDGGVHSNTPLSEAINCLERCGARSRGVKREIIVVELVPMQGTIPNTMEEVISRFFNLIFASKLELDKKLFVNYSEFMDLAENIDFILKTINADEKLKKELNDALASAGRGATVHELQDHPGFKGLLDHRRIDAFTMIPFTAAAELRSPSDFSKASIEARIEAGQQEARKQNIGEYRFLGKSPAQELGKLAA